MYALLKREINSYFNSLTGYIIIAVFLLITGLIMWTLPGQFNILDMGYANIDTFFVLAPWVFLFLGPATTMKLFAEEKKTGTLEMLVTRPLSELQIVLAKYFAGLTLIVFSIFPTLIYFVSVYFLGNPVGNLDSGGIWGSYIGLFFLAGIYVSIGVFASSLTDNQIIAFIIAAILSFFWYLGFDAIGSLSSFSKIGNFIISLGINEHYRALSKGVVDTRDLVYFLSMIAFFIFLTKISLESRKW